MGKGAKSPQEKKKKDVVSAKRLDRAFKVFELRKNGGSFRAIAETLKKQAEAKGESTRGYSHTQVKADYELAVQVKTEDLGDMVTSARILTAERLDDIYLRISPLLADKNVKAKTKIAAANTLIRANKEYAELHGAKRPQAIEVTGAGGTPLIPKDLSVTINSIYDDDGDPAAGDEPDDTDSESGGDAEGPA